MSGQENLLMNNLTNDYTMKQPPSQSAGQKKFLGAFNPMNSERSTSIDLENTSPSPKGGLTSIFQRQ